MKVKLVNSSPWLNSPPDEDGGSIEAAVAQMKEARAEAAPEPKTIPALEPAAPVATVEAEESPPEQLDAADEVAEEADADAGPEPTVDAPASFTPEEKEMFKALPPEQQQSMLRLAKGAQAAESRRQNEHQAAIREAQELSEKAAQERQQLQSALQHYKHPMVTAFQQEFADLQDGRMDLFRLAQDPARWGRYQAFQTSFQQLANAERQIAQEAEREEGARLQQHVETRNSQLIEAKPELKDPAKFEQYDAEVSTYLRGLNIPDERIQRVSFEELTIIEKAMKWDKAQKAKAAVPKPQANAGQPQGNVRQMPRVMKPGMGNSSGAVDDKIAAIDQRAQKTGSVDDAAARIRARLGRRA
ncbi:MAG: hypothetical protein Q8L53_16780 [Aestuariivirga sp.]|nr:hypothetical protein [Aestuariivirga sp.]